MDEDAVKRAMERIEKIEYLNSQEYKDKVEFERLKANQEFWADVNSQSDRQPEDYADFDLVDSNE